MKDNQMLTNEFVQLFEKHQKKIFFIILGIVKNKDDAEDVFQNTAYKGYKYFHSIKDVSAFNTWIIKIAINNSYDFIKQHKASYNIEELQIPYYDNYSDSDILLQSALHSLSQDERIVVMLKAIEEMRYDEISQITGRPVNTLKSVYKRSLEKLRQYLNTKEYTSD